MSVLAFQDPESIVTPTIAWYQLAPMLAVFAAATLGVLVEAFVPAAQRRVTQVALSLAGLAVAFGYVVRLWGAHDNQVVADGVVAVDGPALFLQGTLVLLAVAALLLLGERGGRTDPDAAVPRDLPTESFPLALLAVGGMMLFVSATNLLLLFVALEILSLPLYLLTGLARRRRIVSQEGALKYFLLGAFSSAFFLYGVALLYGYAGTVSFAGIRTASALAGTNDVLLYAGLALLGVGLLFKVGAVPFHAWTPDVYQAAPTPVTALMAAATKVAAFGGLTRVLFVVGGGVVWDWRPAVWAVAILTMVVGAVVAVTQQDVKRMLAYSSVAHAGFILCGVAAANNVGLRGVLFYLLAYGFTVLGAFGIVTLVRNAEGEATHLSQWQGLGRRSPVVAGVFAFFLFALAGIPLTSGFTAKFAVFSAAVEGRATPLVVVGVLTSAVAAFFYARVIVLMFFQEPAEDGPTVVLPSAPAAAALGLAVTVTALLGIVPGEIVRLADVAARGFVR
ncbi:MAG TPA: NADH-quinone oxidoreductase subunit NuoN [Mycobacteriales bacterium]|jgi:NADH-quinone oxidoreductase subunit N